MRPFFFFHLFVFVFILDEHPWHAIDVFVRLPECRFNSAIILQPKKLFYFTLAYLEIPWLIMYTYKKKVDVFICFLGLIFV